MLEESNPEPVRGRRQALRRTLDQDFRRAVKELPKTRKAAAQDYYYACVAAGLSPFPVTQETLDKAEAWLSKSAPASAHSRAISWRSSINKLGHAYRATIGLEQPLPQPRGKRTRNAAAGTFIYLEEDLSKAKGQATRPRTGDCDPHTQAAPSYCDAMGRQMLILATTLISHGHVTVDVTIKDLLTTEMQTRFLSVVDGLVGDEAARIPVADTLKALRFYSFLLLGRASPEAKFASLQTAERVASDLSHEAIKALTILTQTDQLKLIAGLPERFMLVAEAKSNWRTALRYANLAAAAVIQSEFLLRPEELAALRLSADGMPIIPPRRSETTGKHVASEKMKEILSRRDKLLKVMKRDSSRLFQGYGHEGTQLERCVSKSFGKASHEVGLPLLTLQRLRDIGAILLLRDNPVSVRRVAALLDVVNVKGVTKRYKPFLTQNGA